MRDFRDFRVFYRYRNDKREVEQDELVRALHARDALTIFVQSHVDDTTPVVLLRVRED